MNAHEWFTQQGIRLHEPKVLTKIIDADGNEKQADRSKLLNLTPEQAFRIQQDQLLAKHLVTIIP